MSARIALVCVPTAALACLSASGGASDPRASPPLDANEPEIIATRDDDGGDANAIFGANDAPLCDAAIPIDPIAAEADTLLPENACGSISYGTSPFLNCGVGIGVTLVRFRLPATLVSALRSGRVASLRLELSRGGDCGGSACPAAAGTLRAFPLRNDWVEGDGGRGPDGRADGATWCTRMTATAWGAPGASKVGEDRGSTGGVAHVGASDPRLLLALPTDVFDGAWLDATTGALSIVLVPSDGATFVFSSRETAQGPRLVADVCP